MPGPTNTGPTDPNSLTVNNGSMTVTTPGAVIQNLEILGVLTIEAPNVTVNNCLINPEGADQGGGCALMIQSGANNVTIENTTVTGTCGQGTAIYTGGDGNVISHVQIYNTGSQGIRVAGSVTIENCWFYEMGWNATGIASNPLVPGFNGTAHDNDIFIERGASIVIQNNNFDTPNETVNGITYENYTAIFQDPFDSTDVIGGVLIKNNYINNAGYMFYLMGQGTTQIVDNILVSQPVGPLVNYSAYISGGYIGAPWIWSGNVDGGGNAIAIPTGLPVAGTT